MENNYASTYRRIMSSTAIFGGAQALSVFVNIIRAKLVASILHSRGMGMSSVITNAANGLQQLSLLGLNVAAVPDISKAHAEDDERVLSFTVRIVRRLVLTASIIGLIATMALSPLLSQLSFETHGYTRYFMLLSVAVFFNVLGTGELSHTAAVVEVRRGEAETESLGRRLGSWGTRGGGQRSKVQSKDLVSLENHQSVSQQTLTTYPEE